MMGAPVTSRRQFGVQIALGAIASGPSVFDVTSDVDGRGDETASLEHSGCSGPCVVIANSQQQLAATKRIRQWAAGVSALKTKFC